MTFFAIVVVTMVLLTIVTPAMQSPVYTGRRDDLPVALYTHVIAGAVALGTGAFQFSRRLRARRLAVHRLMGRSYVVAVALSGTAGLAMAPLSDGGLAGHFGFGGMALLWLITTACAFTAARARRIDDHERWMIRSYALTLAAVTLRLYLPAMLVAGIPFDSAYPAIAWLCWVPNLVIAEWWLLRPRKESVR
jgi:uncharacterized membrane protein